MPIVSEADAIFNWLYWSFAWPVTAVLLPEKYQMKNIHVAVQMVFNIRYTEYNLLVELSGTHRNKNDWETEPVVWDVVVPDVDVVVVGVVTSKKCHHRLPFSRCIRGNEGDNRYWCSYIFPMK